MVQHMTVWQSELSHGGRERKERKIPSSWLHFPSLLRGCWLWSEACISQTQIWSEIISRMAEAVSRGKGDHLGRRKGVEFGKSWIPTGGCLSRKLWTCLRDRRNLGEVRLKTLGVNDKLNIDTSLHTYCCIISGFLFSPHLYSVMVRSLWTTRQ